LSLSSVPESYCYHDIKNFTKVAIMKKLTNFLILLVLIISLLPIGSHASDRQFDNEIKKADWFMLKFEKNVKRYKGKPFTLAYDDKQALKRIRSLMGKQPEDSRVAALAKRAKSALMASKGDFLQITPEMLAYRNTEKILVQKLSGINVNGWDTLQQELADSNMLLNTVFPALDPLETDVDEMIGKKVIFKEFLYPDNEFSDTGGQFVFVGSPGKGLYYVKLGGRPWLGVYEALKRYKRQISDDIKPPWTLVGEITGVNLLVPQAGEEKTMEASFGWVVKPVAIYIEGKVLTLARPELEKGGIFYGEDQVEKIKENYYTYSTVPDTVEPQKLVKILAASGKEKNWELFKDCIDPMHRKTRTALSRLRYFYDNTQERYDYLYVHVDPYELVSITAIKGASISSGSDEDFFLDDNQKQTLTEHREPLVEEAVVMIRTFNEFGKQAMLAKKVILRRYDSGRWYIYSGYPL